jgi:uncharacterized membrane protein
VAGKNKNVEEDKLGDGLKTLGTILELVSIPVTIVNIALLKMPNTDLEASTILLIVSILMFFTGFMLSHLPKQVKEEKER